MKLANLLAEQQPVKNDNKLLARILEKNVVSVDNIMESLEKNSSLIKKQLSDADDRFELVVNNLKNAYNLLTELQMETSKNFDLQDNYK